METATEPAAVLARPRVTRKRMALLGLVPMLTLVTSTVGAALSPTLLVQAPALLILLDPRPTHLVLAASSTSAVAFFSIAIARWLVADPFLFEMGRLRGPESLAWIEKRTGRFGRVGLRFLERVFTRASSVVVFVAPGPLVCLYAGARGMSWSRFAVANVAGTVASITGLWVLAGHLSSVTARLLDFIEQHLVTLTAVTVTLAILAIVSRARKARKERGAFELDAAITPGSELDR